MKTALARKNIARKAKRNKSFFNKRQQESFFSPSSKEATFFDSPADPKSQEVAPNATEAPQSTSPPLVLAPQSSCDDAKPDRNRWMSNLFLNKIRAAQAGDNQHLLRFGATGEPVELVQQALTAWGCQNLQQEVLPAFGVDAIFGSETKAAIVRFQTSNDLDPDGIVGPITLAELDKFVGIGSLPVIPDIPMCRILETASPGTKQAFFPVRNFSPALAKTADQQNTIDHPDLGQSVICLASSVCACDKLPEFIGFTYEVGSICSTKACAPAVLQDNSHICMGEGDSVKVLKIIPAKTADGSKEIWLKVKVLDGKFKDQIVLIRDRFLDFCTQPEKPKKPEKKPEVSCHLPIRILNDDNSGRGADFAFFDKPSTPSDKDKILKFFRAQTDKKLKEILRTELGALAGGPGRVVSDHFTGGSGTTLIHKEGSKLGKDAKGSPSIVKLNKEVETELSKQLKAMAGTKKMNACKVKIAKGTINRPNFHTKFTGGDSLALHAVFGGTQGLLIDLHQFNHEPAKNQVEVELKYTITDDFGVDLTDVTNQGIKGLSDGLKAFWVLQHERAGNRPFIDKLKVGHTTKITL